MASYRRLPSGLWQATVKHPSGKRYTKTDPLKGIVKGWAEDLETQIRRGDFVDPTGGKMTLAGWWAKWSELQRVEATTAAKRETHWRLYVEPTFGTWPLATIQSWDVETWISTMGRDQVRPHAAASAVQLLKQMLNDAVRHKVIRTNQADLVDTPPVPKHDDRVLEDDEIPALLAALTKPGPRKGVRRGDVLEREPDRVNQILVKLMLDTGLRWEEAAGIHGFRVDLLRKKIHVREVVVRGQKIKHEPKTKAGIRDVPLTDDLVDDLAWLIGHRGGREKLLFVTLGRDGAERPLDYTNWRDRVWGRAVEAAGITQLPLPTPHDCRHTYGTTLAEEGVPAHEIMALMGHATLAAVERYLHARSARLARARDAVGARRAHKAPETRRGPGTARGGTGA